MFEIEPVEGGKFRWVFKLSNGRVLAQSAETYPKRSSAQGDIARLKEAAPNARVVLGL